jgi:hypothetical protein
MACCSICELQTRQATNPCATGIHLALLRMCKSMPANRCAGSEDQQYTLQFEEAGSANPMMEMLMKVGCFAVWPSSFIGLLKPAMSQATHRSTSLH